MVKGCVEGRRHRAHGEARDIGMAAGKRSWAVQRVLSGYIPRWFASNLPIYYQWCKLPDKMFFHQPIWQKTAMLNSFDCSILYVAGGGDAIETTRTLGNHRPFDSADDDRRRLWGSEFLFVKILSLRCWVQPLTSSLSWPSSCNWSMSIIRSRCSIRRKCPWYRSRFGSWFKRSIWMKVCISPLLAFNLFVVLSSQQCIILSPRGLC